MTLSSTSRSLAILGRRRRRRMLFGCHFRRGRRMINEALMVLALAVSEPVQVPATADAQVRVVEQRRAARVKKAKRKCKDPVVRWVRAAGFRGEEIRVAW